jgi:hypothetical protein
MRLTRLVQLLQLVRKVKGLLGIVPQSSMTLAQNTGTLSIDPSDEGGGIPGGRRGEGNGECVVVGLGLNDIVWKGT